MHALVIEDDPITAMLIDHELRDLGFKSVDCASTEEEAISSVARRSPDLVTCDGTLRIGSGLAAARVIRQSLPVPIIFITGDAEHARRYMPNAALLEKPFGLAALSRAVAMILPRSEVH